jgi:hypothetical protein
MTTQPTHNAPTPNWIKPKPPRSHPVTVTSADNILPPATDCKMSASLASRLNLQKGSPIGNVNGTGLGLITRMVASAPEHVESISKVIDYSRGVRPTRIEMTNLLLVLEHALTRTHKDDLRITDHKVLNGFIHAVIGLRSEELIAQVPVSIIATREQLESDAAVATFIALYARLLDNEFEAEHPILEYRHVPRTGKGDCIVSKIRNPHLERLIREQPENIERIFEFLTNYGMSDLDVGPVDSIRDYLSASERNISLRDGWL